MSCSPQKNSTDNNQTLFQLLKSSHTNIHFENTIKESYRNFAERFNYVYNGAGVSVGDLNNDGLADIYFTGNEVQDRLYLNLGNMKFEDVTASSGIAGFEGWKNGVLMVDVNNDGYLDIYVCRGGWQDENEDRKNLLFINQHDLTFIESAEGYGLDEEGYSIHAVFFDMDNDNDLDVYIANRPDSFYITPAQTNFFKSNPKEKCRDKLFINDGNYYKEIGKEAGIVNNYGFGLSVVASDINQDGFVDLYVANDFLENDYLYINNGDGTFTERIRELIKHVPLAAMGTDIADINNDGLEDIFVTEMSPNDYVRSKTTMPPMNRIGYQSLLDQGFYHQYMHNVLQLNRGGHFSEIANLAGVTNSEWTFASLLADFDNDGYRDIFTANGYKRDVYDMDAYYKKGKFINMNLSKYPSEEKMYEDLANEIIGFYPQNKTSNFIFKNNGDLTFSDKTLDWGLEKPSFSNGAAYADLDNDGDLDLIINNVDEEAFIYKNNSEKLRNHFLKVKLSGPERNNNGLGAKITLTCAEDIFYSQFKVIRGYLSSVEPIAHFGLGNHSKINKLTVEWPDGKVNRLTNINADQLININYNQSSDIEFVKSNNQQKALFSEITKTAFSKPFTHKENPFDDYNLQELLPHKFSDQGPGLAVGDLNNDGLDDFFIGGAWDQEGRVFIQQQNETFLTKENNAFKIDKGYEDVDCIFFDADADGYLDLYVVSGGFEFRPNSAQYQDRLYINDGHGNFTKSEGLPKINSSGGCVVAFDLENDGDKDLFVGGYVVPYYYPFPPKSLLLENDSYGNFKDITTLAAPELQKIGMVSSVVACDMNNDNFSDLIIVGEWMPIHIFKNKGGILSSDLSMYGLDDTNGWWNKVVADDIDQDGDIDLIVGNVGLNYKYKASKDKPFQIYADDFDLNGSIDIFLTTFTGEREVPVRGYKSITKQLPAIRKKFPSYMSFAKADISDLIGTGISMALRLKVFDFSSILLINDNGTFVKKQLPVEAQFSAIQDMIVYDFDGDDINDILLGGNKYGIEIETTRMDASEGLLLKGKANGEFEAANYTNSGFFIPYDVRYLETISLGENKVGVLVASNNDTLRLFKFDPLSVGLVISW